jgi:feruloyl esterase
MKTHRLICGLLVACAVAVAPGSRATIAGAGLGRPWQAEQAPPPRPSATTEHAECSHLVMLRFPDVKVTQAISVRAAEKGSVRAAHCKVDGVIGTEIRFELLLPDQWNRKLTMGGGGGFGGTVQNAVEASVNSGYATVGTDTGHTGGAADATWALNNVERQLNFGYLAIHRTAEVAKAVVASYYGSAATRNYFLGCSRGGGQAMMEAQRFPGDFDGIVAGAPAYDWSGLAAQFVRNAQVAFPDGRNLGTSPFTPAQLTLVESSIVAACDALDGVKDGLMEDPRRCTFNVDTIATCATEQPGPQCLTASQHGVLKALYAPTTNRAGVIYPGQPFGGEGEAQGWRAWITGPNGQAALTGTPSLRFAFGTGIFKYIVFGDPSWDYTKYNLDNLSRDTKLAATFLNATDANLDAFKGQGRKLLLWHGWSDPALTPLATIRYYEQVQARDPNVRDYARMFMMPGMLHCIGGPGPDTADWTETIDAWVESGKAPDRIIARKVIGGSVTRTRPLCPYPQRATYTGSGSIDAAENFACRQP